MSISVSTCAFLPLLSTLSHPDWLPTEESGVEIRSSCFPVCYVLLEDSLCFGTSSSLRHLPACVVKASLPLLHALTAWVRQSITKQTFFVACL